MDGAARKTVLFGDRFPFRYLVDDYGLRYYAAFAGCSAESEASFETVSFLAKKVDELGLPCLLLAVCMMVSLCACGKGSEKDAGKAIHAQGQQ